LLVCSALACSRGGGPGHYDARGVVREVQAELGQVIIEHEDVPGLMPAMTMNFDAEPALLETLEPGQRIDFEIEFTGKSYRVTHASVRGASAGPGGGPTLAGAAQASEPAPDFALVDQDGAPRTLSELRGKAVLLDFIFTHCTGPCPILTSSHVTLQRSLAPELRARSAFVSISLDPVRDTPEALRQYARRRGAELDHWWFLTGPAADVQDVVRRYGVGTAREPEGELQHLVVSFLIDPQGRIARRYVGLEHDPADIERDIERALR
jgi:protein SCO1/2